jgi:hypothetical protein
MITLLKADFRQITSADAFFHASVNCDKLSFKFASIGELFSQKPGRKDLSSNSYLFIPTAGTATCNTTLLEPNSLVVTQGNFVETNNAFHCFYIALRNAVSPKTAIVNWELNKLINVLSCDELHVQIGQFQGRETGGFEAEPNREILCLVLSGAFECNDRLIETADVLLFTNESHIEFEALSEFATLILITS